MCLVLRAGYAQSIEDEGPIVLGQKEGLKGFRLERVDVALRFDGRWREEKIRQSGEPTRKNTEDQYEEWVDISTRSYIGHRNLCDLTADLSLGWQNIEATNELTGLDQSDSGTLSTYNISALLLGESKAPTTVYANQSRTLFDREFSGSYDSTLSEYGAIVTTFMDTAPTTFQLFHREQDDDEQFGLADYHLTQDTLSVHSDWSPTERQNLLIDYALDRVDESRGSIYTNSYDRHDATITHTLRFGPEDRHSLRSSLRIYDQSGDYAQSTYRLDEILRLRHTDRFETRYDLTGEQRTTGGRDQNRYRLSGLARHKLFDSLVTTFSLGASQTTMPDENFTSDEYFTTLNFDYVKRVPYGQFNAGLGLNLDNIKNSDRGDTIPFRDERVTFNDPLPVIIARRNIVPESVLVTNLAGTYVYVEGLDYTLSAFPDRIELRRVVGGAIADGQTVLVDFDLGPEPANSIDSFTHTIVLRYTIQEGRLRGLSTYLTYSDVSQELDAVDPSLFTLNDQTRLLLGTELRRGPVTLTAEHEDVSSDISPYTLLRLQARYDQRLGARSWVSLEATHEEVDYGQTDRSVELNRLTGEIGRMLAPGLHGRLRLRYRDESDNIGGDTRGFEELAELKYTRGQTDLYATVRYSQLESDATDTQSQLFSFGLRRAF
ncbi:MAG: hypothetical protein KJZ65_12935 [Phycisphaerales bacterium]|nr:hypothetical protein [Phycisphaerales bacterium]